MARRKLYPARPDPDDLEEHEEEGNKTAFSVMVNRCGFRFTCAMAPQPAA